jgi:hypothetical protein
MSSNAAAPSVIQSERRLELSYPNWNVRRIVSLYEPVSDEHPQGHGRIYLPGHQREWSWKHAAGLKKQQKFIDSVLHNFPIPMVILNQEDDGVRERWQIYDGRHRVETLWRFLNNKFSISGGIHYRDLNDADRTRFNERIIPVAITVCASNEQLADIFTRLNAGKALTQADYCWANKHVPLVRDTMVLLEANKERLNPLFGGTDITSRKSLPDWVGLVAGIVTANSGNMTTSFERLQAHFDREVDIAVTSQALDALVELYTRANTLTPVSQRELRAGARVGFINAFFVHDWMAATADEKEATIANWTLVIKEVRTGEDGIGKRLIATTGAQNLNSAKISAVIARVHAWLSGIHPEVDPDESIEDSDSDA